MNGGEIMLKKRTSHESITYEYLFVEIGADDKNEKFEENQKYIGCVGKFCNNKIETGERFAFHFYENSNNDSICQFMFDNEIVSKQESEQTLTVTTKNAIYVFCILQQ